MANVKLIFCSDEDENVQLRCYPNDSNQIFIEIEDVGCDHCYNIQYTCLDKATAIELLKTLKTAIDGIE